MINGEWPLINPDDISIAVCLNNADEAIEMLQKHHDKWLTKK